MTRTPRCPEGRVGCRVAQPTLSDTIPMKILRVQAVNTSDAHASITRRAPVLNGYPITLENKSTGTREYLGLIWEGTGSLFDSWVLWYPGHNDRSPLELMKSW